MAITQADFNKIWASTSPLTPYEFSESNYKEGWNFIGGTPPSRQMWDFLQKNNDEKMQYLADNYLPLSGGTMTGGLKGNRTSNDFTITNMNADYGLLLYGYNQSENNGATLKLNSKDALSNAGNFYLKASNGTNKPALIGKPDGTLTWDGQPLLPVGVVQAFAGTTIPNGWLLCDGSAVSRTTYANLYACIGDAYGSGDGSTTFNLPDLIDKFVQGNAVAGTEHSAGLPNITGNSPRGNLYGQSGQIHQSGAFYGEYGEPAYNYTLTPTGDASRFVTSDFDASRSNSIYGNSTTVQPPALTMLYIIKY